MKAVLVEPPPPGRSELTPAVPAMIGFAVAGVLLTALDLRSPAAVLTDTISAHAAGGLRTAFVFALLASCAGVAASIVWARCSARPAPLGGLVLLTMWPAGIAIATVFDEAEHTATGMIHNVAVGTAVVAVHLAALRSGPTPLRWLAAVGVLGMAVLLVMIVLKEGGDAALPVGVVERALIAVSAAVTVGALRGPARGRSGPLAVDRRFLAAVRASFRRPGLAATRTG